MDNQSNITKIFVSYSHNDRKHLEDFKKTLTPIQSGFGFELWEDTKLQPGDKWKDEILKALHASKIAVLLVSREFLASRFIAQNELPPILEKAQEEGLTVFWVLVSDCIYQQTEIAKFEAAYDPNKPIDHLTRPKKNTAWKEICSKLLDAVKTKQTPKHKSGSREIRKQSQPEKPALDTIAPISIDNLQEQDNPIEPNNCPVCGTGLVFQLGVSSGRRRLICPRCGWERVVKGGEKGGERRRETNTGG